MFQLHKALSKLLTEQMLSERKRECGEEDSIDREGELLRKKEWQCRETRECSQRVCTWKTKHIYCLPLALLLSLPLSLSLSVLLYLPFSISLLPGIVCCFNQSKLTLGVKFIKMEIFRLLRYCFCLHVAIASLRRLVSGRCLLASCFLRQ